MRKLPTAERVARQKEQEDRLTGIIFTPEVMPSNKLVDQFVEMASWSICRRMRALAGRKRSSV